MMTEAKLTKKFCDAYRARRPDALVEKVNDRVAMSRPDVNVTDCGQTFTIEFKKWNGKMSEGQTRDLERRCKASRGRAYVAWFGQDGSVRFVRPGDAPIVCATIKDAAATLEQWILSRAA